MSCRRPDELIGMANVVRLNLAGWRIVPLPPAPASVTHLQAWRFTCPCCGYTADLDALRGVYAQRRRIWHRACVPEIPNARPPLSQAMRRERVTSKDRTLSP